MDVLLWLLAVVLVVAGVMVAFQREIMLGVLLVALALLVGPGGVSLLA